MPESTPAIPTIMGRLKAASEDLHRMAEGRDLQRLLVRGTLPRPLYETYLAQMHLVHTALEDRIREVAREHPAFASVLRDYHWREPQLRADLVFLGGEVAQIEPLPAARALIEHIDREAADCPVALLGMLYVLEGSTNGSKFIARSIGKAYGLSAGPGLSYLDPHGDLQRDRWLTFKQDMNAVDLSENEKTRIIAAARATFQAVADLSDELMEPVGVS